MERQDAPAARWWQLTFGIMCMAMIANLQYGWTLFVDPIDAKYHWGRAAIQLAFTIFVATETWLVPIEAWFVDRYGPRVVVCFGGVMIAIAWVLNSYADIPAAALSRGRDRRHRRRRRSTGPVSATRSSGSRIAGAWPPAPPPRASARAPRITVVPIARMIATSGYQDAFLYFGLGQGIIVVLLSLFLRASRRVAAAGPAQEPAPAADQGRPQPRARRCARRSSGSCT